MTFEKTFRRGDRVVVDGDFATFVRLSLEAGRALVDFEPRRAPFHGGLASVEFDRIRPAPVRIVGPRPAQPPTTCPSCGSALQRTVADRVVDTNGRRRKKEVAVIACSGCEFVEEVKY